MAIPQVRLMPSTTDTDPITSAIDLNASNALKLG